MSQPILYLDYTKTTADLINAGIKKSDIFYPFASPDKKDYLNFFWTWQTSMSYYDRLLNVRPCRFYYINKTSMEAIGGFDKGCFIVGISAGMVYQLKKFFIEDNEDIFIRFADDAFSNLNEIGINSLQSLMRDFSLRFAMDHEFGHVIQQSDNRSSWSIEEFNELTNCDEIYSEESHIREFDADIRGAFGATSAILGYWDSTEECKKTEEYLRILITSGIASIACFFSLLPTADFYVEKFKHPHPVIRIQYIMTYLHNMLRDKGQLRSMNWDKLFDDVWKISNLFLNRKADMSVTNLYDVFISNRQAISNHIKTTLLAKYKNYPYLALNKPAALALPKIDMLSLHQLEMQDYMLQDFRDGF
ncbi:hypothetical protein [Chitinophaga sp. MM2321]|uniref:hypothetical protein n=1 Tax=Chitinophaga sp. MM2321 TaxID=3137178 RepID=UPI0032D59807